MANITGWGRGTWGEGAWNAPLAVEVTGVAGTTALGSETVVAQTVASVDFRDSLMATSFSQEFGLTVDGFVNDGQTISNGSAINSITNTERGQDIVLAAEMDLPSSFSKASCIWECGGTGTGAWLGISEQSGAYFLRFRAGDGTSGNNTANSNLAIAQVAISSLSGFFDGNTHTLVWAVDISAGKVEIYIDGELVAEGTTSDGSSLSAFAGGANGSFGVGNGTSAGGESDDGSTQFQSADAFTGTIRSDLRMYKNEFIATQTNSTQTGTSVVAVTGNQASGQIGDEVTRPQGIFGVTGVQGTTALGNVSAAPQTIVSVTNVAGTGALGSASISGGATFAVTGVAGTSAVGNESTVGDNLVVITGTAGTGAIGAVTVVPSIEIVPTGQSGTGAIGDVLAAGGAKVVEDAVTGIVNLGDEAVSGTANVSVTGVSATGGIRTDDTGTVIFAVEVRQVSGANYYFIDGVQQATLSLTEGKTYRFDQSSSAYIGNSGHPLRFSTTSNGTHGGGTEYTTGVTTNGTPGSAGAYTEITVAIGAPTLYYYCTNHSGMGGQINTIDSSDLVVTGTALFAVTGSAGTSAVGTAIGVIPVTVSVTGLSGTSSVGSESVLAINNIVVTGVTGTGTLGTLNLYGIIANEVSVSYTEVVPSQNANYEAA